MNHQKIREQIFLLGDPELPAEESAALRKHLETCAQCREISGQWRKLREVFRQAPAVRPSAAFTANVMRRLEAPAENMWAKALSIFRADWVMPAVGYAFAVLLMGIAIAHRAPLENMDQGLLSGAAPSEEWVVSGDSPDMRQLLGITMEGS
jgi:anti-sigma factor RsiW